MYRAHPFNWTDMDIFEILWPPVIARKASPQSEDMQTFLYQSFVLVLGVSHSP